MQRTFLSALSLFAALSTGCGHLYTVEKPGMHVAAVEEDQHWTCPHEGGDFKHPGKCPNSWCQMELVPLKKK